MASDPHSGGAIKIPAKKTKDGVGFGVSPGGKLPTSIPGSAYIGGGQLPVQRVGASLSQLLSGGNKTTGNAGSGATGALPNPFLTPGTTPPSNNGGGRSSSGGSGGGGSTPAAPAPAPATITATQIAQDRKLMSQEDWLTKYGNINFDANAIKGIFDAATNAAYAAKDREYAATERKFYDQKGTEQLSVLDGKRRAAAQNAVQTGANKGMQNAMQLTDIVKQSATTAPDALMLAEGRRALIDQTQAELVANAKEAETVAEQRKLDYAKVGSEIYATDAQKYVGELGYDAATLEALMTKYGIDRTKGGGYQELIVSLAMDGLLPGRSTTTPPRSFLDSGDPRRVRTF